MENIIRLVAIQKEKGKIVYKYNIQGEWEKVFRKNREFFIEYDIDVSDVPDSILAVPFLANILPIAWVYDAEIQLDEIDKDFIECIDEVKRAYVEMYSKILFKGRIKLNKIRKNDFVGEENKSLLFFSGGVDATSSLINVRQEKPMLCTLWGSDIFFQDTDGWNNVQSQVIKTASTFELPYTFIKTSFRPILNYDVLNNEIAKPNHENWWHGFQHGIAIIAHAAPIAYLNRMNKIYIAATKSLKSSEDFTCASTPTIDNNIKFCGASVLHEGVENSRSDKIRKICRYSKTNNKKLKLRVCWITRSGDNCCKCEKCGRTLLSILAEGYSPNDFGFDMDAEKYNVLLDLIKEKKINIPYKYWGDIISKFSCMNELQNEIPLVKYLVENNPKYNMEYKSKMNYTSIKVLSEVQSAVIFRSKQDFSTLEKSFASVGMNSGNLVFYEALKKNLNLNTLSYTEYINRQEELASDKVITTDLIWINENSNFDYLFNQLEKMKYQTMIPISVGLQASNYSPNFKLNDSVMRVLSAIQERAIIGVRGDYTASILEKHGINNFEVIGCPSMYYWDDSNHKIVKKNIVPQKVAINFRTFYGKLNKDEKHFLTYAANRNYDFVEQTKYNLEPKNVSDSNYFAYVSKWLERNKKIYFSTSAWSKYIKDMEFSMGARFHGNVIALWNSVPALFFTIDSRTEELIRYFNLPYISIDKFDETKPIEYYYELADYSDFNREYHKKYKKYEDFLKKNGLLI